MPHLVWVTNIPTPYRNHRYRVFSDLLPPMGLTFEVAFMARTESNRHWTFSEDELDFPHKFFRGVHPEIRQVEAHVNPGLVSYVRRRRPDLLVLGGYAAPTLLALAMAPPKNSRVLLAAESTLDSPYRWRNSRIGSLKHRVVGKCSGYIVPGPRSEKYLMHLDPAVATKPVFQLPNIVDYALYRDGVEKLRHQRAMLRAEMGFGDHERIWIVPARLHPIKGLDRFLPLFSGATNTRVLLAGDGPQRDQLEQLCRSSNINATFLGAVAEPLMLRLYSIADMFALPSLQDPSPLSAVEALAAGLPVLLSERAGNVDEVVQPSNGWKYDPDLPNEMATLVGAINGMDQSELEQMGTESRRVYAENFDSRRWVAQLGNELLSITRSCTASSR